MIAITIKDTCLMENIPGENNIFSLSGCQKLAYISINIKIMNKLLNLF